MRLSTTSIILLLSLQFGNAQYQIGLVPRISPDKSVSQTIGFTQVDIKYGSPSINDRQLWGGIVPYNKVWRAGANNATIISISDEITFNNMVLDSGSYSFFLIPKENDKWTVIFNKNHKQWGAFKYDESTDALRVDIIPRRAPFSSEQLVYTIDQLGYQYGSINMQWGHTVIKIPFETNYIAKFKNEVQSRVDLQPDYLKWIVFIQGAEHLVEIGKEQSTGLQWINKAEEIMNSTKEWNDQFYPRDYVKGHLYWTKAKLHAATDSLTEAVVYGQKVKELESNISTIVKMNLRI